MSLKITVLPGDGIGIEVMEAALTVLQALEDMLGFKLAREQFPAGAAYYRETGADMPEAAWQSVRNTDAILFGAIGLPDVRYPNGTEIAPHLEMRREFGLYAGVRPVRTMPNVQGPLGDPRAAQIDMVVVRESTEGLFASRGKGVIEDDQIARETMVISRPVCERLFDYCFRLARKRKARGGPGRVTCVDKSNVFVALAFFRKIFDERAQLFPDIVADHHYVDAMALDMVRRPWDFDVLVMENMFGDILSDLGGGIVGSMGLAPCGEIGDAHALFQPSHGTAPDIAGTDKANPTAMLLSTAMMLEWLAERHGDERLHIAASALDAAVEQAYRDGAVRPFEFGGKDGTRTISEAVLARLPSALANVEGGSGKVTA